MTITINVKTCNRANVEFLIGATRLTGARNLPDAIDYALSEECGSLRRTLSEAAGDSGSLPGLCVLATEPSSIALHGTYSHKFAHEEAGIVFKKAGVPRITFRIQRSDSSVKFECSAPLVDVLRTDDLSGTYSVYRHAFGASPGKLYIGITKQGWTARWKQHLCAATGGSPYLFHQAIRKYQAEPIGEFHRVIASGLTFEEAMEIEEEMVEGQSLYPKGLNMIPGGFAGIRYLGQRGYHGVTQKNWEHRSRLLREFSKYCDRTGRPNPLLAAVWKNDDYAASVICSNPNNFDLERVREARLLASFNWTSEQIAERFACKPARVEQLIRGSTYARVH